MEKVVRCHEPQLPAVLEDAYQRISALSWISQLVEQPQKVLSHQDTSLRILCCHLDLLVGWLRVDIGYPLVESLAHDHMNKSCAFGWHWALTQHNKGAFVLDVPGHPMHGSQDDRCMPTAAMRTSKVFHAETTSSKTCFDQVPRRVSGSRVSILPSTVLMCSTQCWPPRCTHVLQAPVVKDICLQAADLTAPLHSINSSHNSSYKTLQDLTSKWRQATHSSRTFLSSGKASSNRNTWQGKQN